VKLRWLRSGSVTLRHHVDFITVKNPTAAVRVRRRIRSSVLRLLDFPESGRVGQVPGTRELIVGDLPYIVLYRISGDMVEILRVFHDSQDYPASFH